MDATSAHPEPPRKLASDDDRRRVTDELSSALGRGQLQFAEFEERSAQAWACRYRDELLPLVSDIHDDPEGLAGLQPTRLPLPAAPSPDAPVAFATGGAADPRRPLNARSAVDLVRRRITGEKNGSEISFSLMGGATRHGDWLVSASHTSITVMGGNDVDLREARFESGETRIYAFAVMGGIDVIVPEGVRVICDGIGVMGGFDASVDKRTLVRPAELPADAPVVRVSGLALMGGVSVITRPRQA